MSRGPKQSGRGQCNLAGQARASQCHGGGYCLTSGGLEGGCSRSMLEDLRKDVHIHRQQLHQQEGERVFRARHKPPRRPQTPLGAPSHRRDAAMPIFFIRSIKTGTGQPCCHVRGLLTQDSRFSVSKMFLFCSPRHNHSQNVPISYFLPAASSQPSYSFNTSEWIGMSPA